MENRRNYYRILQVQPEASSEVIKASYRTLMGRLKHHPDLGGNPVLATWLNAAYEILSDPKKRAEYDLRLLIRARQAALFPRFHKRRFSDPASREGRTDPRDDGSGLARVWSSGEKNRRAAVRFEKKGVLRYARNPAEGQRQGELIDLSLNGLQFVSSERLASLTRIEIESPDWSGTATVRHCREKSSHAGKRFFYGARFSDVRFHKPRGAFLSVIA